MEQIGDKLNGRRGGTSRSDSSKGLKRRDKLKSRKQENYGNCCRYFELQEIEIVLCNSQEYDHLDNICWFKDTTVIRYNV